MKFPRNWKSLQILFTEFDYRNDQNLKISHNSRPDCWPVCFTVGLSLLAQSLLTLCFASQTTMRHCWRFLVEWQMHCRLKCFQQTVLDSTVKAAYFFILSTTCMLHTGRFYRATACNAAHGIAVVILSACPPVCLSVRRLYCDKTKWWTADILIPHDTAITLVFRHQQWLVGDAPYVLKSALEVTHPLRKTPTSTDFRS